jgi:hypothetical protein
MRGELMSFQRRLELVRADPKDLTLMYQPGAVTRFVLKNLAALVFGLPLFALGLALFYLPYLFPRWVSRKAELDMQATVKFLAAFLMVVVCWAGTDGGRLGVGRVAVGSWWRSWACPRWRSSRCTSPSSGWRC